MPPTRTDYELALQAWAAAAAGPGVDVLFAPRSAGRSGSDSYVMVQAVRRQRLGQPVRGATTDLWEGGPGFVGGQAHTYRVRADLNCYGNDAQVLAEALDTARWRPETLPADVRLRIETLSDWRDLSGLEGPGFRPRQQAELVFQWVSVKLYETRIVQSTAPGAQMLS